MDPRSTTRGASLGAPPLAEKGEPPRSGRRDPFLSAFQYSGRAFMLVWQTSRAITLWLLALSVVAGVLPAAIAYVGKLIVDVVVSASAARASGGGTTAFAALHWVLVELSLVSLLAFAQRGLALCDSLLRALLGQRVNELILDKALTLTLSDFEDSEFYDRMTRARREASHRPLSLVKRAFGIAQHATSLALYGVLLFRYSVLAVVILVIAAIPAFVAEKSFSDDAFRLFRWRSPEARMQTYLETLLAREDHAKEVTLFRLGPLFLSRYRAIFAALFAEDRALAVRRAGWVLGLSLLSTLTFYGTYGFIVTHAVSGQISLGDMTLYLMVFRQGQAALSAILSAIGGMYEDNLYLSNLYEFLGHDPRTPTGSAQCGPQPGDGIRFQNVSFGYRGAERPALRDVTLHIAPGSKLALVGENGAGKTTLIKLLTRLYEPTSGTITLDGLELGAWDPVALRKRIGVIFQDFIRYQLIVGENIGAGDVDAFDDRTGWTRAATMGMADTFIPKLPRGFDTQLGRWFKGGQELSLGQWQKIALSRAFMREDADILVLDEPTAAMDAEAEAEVFQRFRALSERRMGIVISHRFSTVRMADQIVVLVDGAVVEHGSHEALMRQNGRYARLFDLQAQGYR